MRGVIIDTLLQTSRYARLHPLFGPAFDFLRSTALPSLPPGRIPLDGDRLFVSIDHVDGRGRDRARLEAHRQYIDIQVTIAGTEHIGWRPLARCGTPAGPFDQARDIGFFADAAETWVVVPAEHFVIFFPDDAHAPLGGTGALQKAIIKVQV
jgi:biofilm protein TabA